MPASDQIFIGIGSNIDPRENVGAALEQLDRAHLLVEVSPAYWAEPIGIPDTNTFLNLAARIRWNSDLIALKTDLTRIEDTLGRTRVGSAWGSRTIDLDILLDGPASSTYGPRPHHVPHPDVTRFAHVAVPLAAIAGDLPHPLLGITIAEIAASFPRHGLRPARATTDV